MSTKDVADFIEGTNFSRIPSNVVTQVKIAVRDSLGVTLAAHADKAVEAARRVAMTMGGKEQSTMIGTGVKMPCNIAAMVNAIMASTLDMDDGEMGPTGHRGHPGGMIVPSCLAVAEYQNATGKDLIEAVVIGYEVALRTGWMMRGTEKPIPSMLRINAGISGTYGVTAAAAKLLKLNQSRIVNAVGIAEAHCPFPPPINTAERGPAMTKEAMGWAAITGVTAALLAQAGFTGPIAIYDLPHYSQEPLETLGKEWEILSLYFKPYSTCRLSHASLDGVFELAKEHNLNAEDIKRITVGLPSYGARLSYYEPATIWQAQYSVPFAIGAVLVDGEVGPAQISDARLDDRAILDQAAKIKLLVDPEVDSLYPLMLGAKVEIETIDGRVFKVLKRYPKGEPQNPLGENELERKFVKLTTSAIGADRTEDLRKCLWRLEDLDNVNELIQKVSHLE
ncbi:MAG: MmgE/PrpD family protein [Chloroflexota bacterium]